MKTGTRLVLSIALACAAGCGVSRATGAEAPAAGRLLVATPRLDGSSFERSVVLLLDCGERGAVGIVIDHPSPHPLADLLPEIGELRAREDRLFLGGPVEGDALFVLLRAPEPPPDSRRVLADVHVSRGTRALRHLLARDASGTRFRAYAGYAGWAPGQLDGEIARGDWLVAPGTDEALFSERPRDLWRQLVLEHGGVEVRAPTENPVNRRLVAAGLPGAFGGHTTGFARFPPAAPPLRLGVGERRRARQSVGPT